MALGYADLGGRGRRHIGRKLAGLKAASHDLPLWPPYDIRGRWVRAAQGYRGGLSMLAYLMAWVDAVAAHEGEGDVEAELETAWRRERARVEGWHTEATRWLAENADPELRAAFAREDVVEVILGYWDLDLKWRPGLAGLEPQECKVTVLSLNGEKPEQIAKNPEMLSKRRQRAGETLPVERVYEYLSRSRAKLRKLFDSSREAENAI